VPIGSLAAKILGEQGLWQLLTDRSPIALSWSCWLIAFRIFSLPILLNPIT
jgi:hypothetical protein